MFHFENSYKVPNARVYGYACKTNLPSNTAFRGFGGPQGMFAAEQMIRHVADYLDRDVVEVNTNLMAFFKIKLTNCKFKAYLACFRFPK